MRTHHKIAIGSFGVIVIIFMVVISLTINGIVIDQANENQNLRDQIEKLESQMNGKINELAVELINTRETLNQGINSLSKNISSTNEDLSKLKASKNEDFSGIVNMAKNSVVTIRTLHSQGSGFFVASGGYIVTNLHVLENDGEISKVIQAIVEDGTIYSGETVGYIEDVDLALIKVDENLPILVLEDSDNVEVGEKVIAIGNPEGLSFSVTDGIVSAVDRNFNGYPYYIQTNTELNPGNSGGPLINTEGKVIGINNFKLVESEGLGFALESNVIKEGVNLIGQKALNQTLIE